MLVGLASIDVAATLLMLAFGTTPGAVSESVVCVVALAMTHWFPLLVPHLQRAQSGLPMVDKKDVDGDGECHQHAKDGTAVRVVVAAVGGCVGSGSFSSRWYESQGIKLRTLAGAC